MAPRPNIRRARERSDMARAEFHKAIRAGHAAGMTTREIAAKAGLSHQRIHQIIRERP